MKKEKEGKRERDNGFLFHRFVDLSTLFPRRCLLIRWLLIIFTFDARRLVWEPADTFHPLPSPLFFFPPSPPPFSFLSLFFFSLPLFTSCPRDTLSSRHPFHAIPLPLRHSQNTSRRFFTLRDHSIGSRDIDVLTESRGDRRGGGGCLWIGSFRPYRPFPPPSLDFYSLWPTRVFAPANHPSKSCSKSFSNNFIVVVRDSSVPTKLITEFITKFLGRDAREAVDGKRKRKYRKFSFYWIFLEV